MARIAIHTYGCTHNRADSERMAGLLAAAGHTLVEDETGADLLILNSCAVKDPAEQRFRHQLREARKRGQPVVAAGCVVQGSPRDEFLQSFSAVGVKDIDRVVEVVEQTLAGEQVRVVTRRRNPSLALPRVQQNPHITIIPVNSGCLSACTYCKTVHARGRLESHSLSEITAAIEAAVDAGSSEIWLTSEDVGVYGADIGESMVSLLRAVAAIRGGFMVRVGMANPQHVRRQLGEILTLLRDHPRRFFRFLHVPVQSGSDAVLQSMERGYAVADFEMIVTEARRVLPDITLMNDYIVGYPTEREEDFQATLALAERTRCRILNINRFYPRPGTRAARLKLLPTKLVAERTKRLVELYEAQDFNKEYLGTEQEVLFTELGKENGAGVRSLVGHTQNYVQVVLNGGVRELLGSWHRVRIVAENKYYLTGELA